MTRLGLLAAAVLLGGCGGSDDATVVLAAASLRDVAPEVDPDARVVTGGSNELAAQLRDGADADVILAAGGKPLEQLRAARLIEAPFVFASNRLVIVVPRENGAQVQDVGDLARDGVQLVLAGEGVPAGDYARETLERAHVEEALENVVSLEADVRGVVAKVALDEADAGIVYATDARAAGDDVRAVEIPERFQPEIRYFAAAVASRSAAAEEYLDRLLGPEGRAALRRAGFLPVPS